MRDLSFSSLSFCFFTFFASCEKRSFLPLELKGLLSRDFSLEKSFLPDKRGLA